MEVFRKYGLAKALTKKHERAFKAVQANDLKTLNKLLNEPGLANGTDVLGTPFLQLAVQDNRIDLTELLLEKGADPNVLNRVGMSPLAFAARFGHGECVRLLLEAGADPNRTGETYQLTPLMGAAVSGNIGIAQRLVKAGASLDTRDVINACSALHWAMFYNHEDFELWILERGANFSESVMDGQFTARSMAELVGHEVIVDWIDRKELINSNLKGSWSLKEISYVQPDTTISISPGSAGRFSFTDHRYHQVYNPWSTERPPFTNQSQPTEAEIKGAFQSIVFNSGSYTLTDSMLVATADIARVPGFEGGKQYYRYKLVGDELHLTLYDETYPDGTKPDWYQKLAVLFKLVRE